MSESKISESIQRRVIAYYSSHAESLAVQYEALSAETVHHAWKHLLPTTPGLALDVGAGSGRDAAWLSSLGFNVIAIEPAHALRERAKQRHAHHTIQWLDDALPALKETLSLNYRYDLILLSAVFMHLVNPDDQRRAFRKLAGMLKPGGRMVITLRHGPNPTGRDMADVSTDDILALARSHALKAVDFGSSADAMKRENIGWSFIVLELPDDGTGALPLLRHLILLDDKSSTYKLALLRVLIRIADGCRGAVLKRDDQFVTLPFGLVALYWLKIYKPLLLDSHYRQQPGNQGYGFVKESFKALGAIGHDLHIGASLSGHRADILVGALRDARNTIKTMPARYLTLPGSDDQVFPCTSQAIRKTDSVTINLPFLSAFGEFKVPTHLWDSMSHYACWIEPAILNEWCQIMRGYHQRKGEQVGLGEFHEALTWKNDERTTTEVRRIVDSIRQKNHSLFCVWTGDSLTRKQYEIDHCFPYANWFNNDLWNLMPTTKEANSQKSNKLIAGERLHASKDRILEWWSAGYDTGILQDRFYCEATASLPGMKNRSMEAVFEGLLHQRLHLKYDQQMPEW